MSLKAFLCLSIVGLVAAEAGKKGYSPKYNLKTYGNPLGPLLGGNRFQGKNGAGYPLNGLSGYGFPGYRFMNGRGLNVLGGYGNYGVYGNGVMPFKGYGFDQGLGGYRGYNNLIGSGAFGVGRVYGYGSYGIGGNQWLRAYGIGGINGYGAYGMGGFGGIGGLNGNGAYGLGGLNGYGSHIIGGFRNQKYGYSGVGKFGGKLFQTIQWEDK
ncbi:unnamed protein product [Mytilus edulis]|uniref:Uncharacterized protein n=1 Tax=Mytilus edulis TaxID=6550 RepID=A0A8S3VMM2_MYTED|nr:unnamed protein product [Mytilus edulis]